MSDFDGFVGGWEERNGSWELAGGVESSGMDVGCYARVIAAMIQWIDGWMIETRRDESGFNAVILPFWGGCWLSENLENI